MKNNEKRPFGWTTIEQSERLVKSGVSPYTGDMCYYRDTLDNCLCLDYNGNEEGFFPTLEKYEPSDEYFDRKPCWSLFALVSLMPDFIYVYGVDAHDSFLKVCNSYVCYNHFDTELSHYVNDVMFSEGDIVSNVVEMILWLIDNKYIKGK